MNPAVYEKIAIPDRVWDSHRDVLTGRDAGRLFRLAQQYGGASQQRLAAATGLPQSRISALLNGRRGVITSLEVWERIALGLNLPDPARVALGLAPRTWPTDPGPNSAMDLSTWPGTAESPRQAAAGYIGEPLECTRRAAASDIGPGFLEHLETLVDDVSVTFAATDPRALLPHVLGCRRRITAVLGGGRVTLRQQRSLYRSAAWLSVILGWLMHDVGDSTSGRSWCLDAWEHAWQADEPEICAWAMDAAASIALYAGNPEAARRAAAKGLAQALAGTAVQARVSCQLMRAQALLGDADSYRTHLHAAQQLVETVGFDDAGLFSCDVARVWSYAATADLWLGHDEAGLAHAEQALDAYASSGADRGEKGPTGRGATRSVAGGSPTRQAIAHLDRAIALARLGEADGAGEAAVNALVAGRITGSVLARAADLVTVLSGRLGQNHPIAVDVQSRLESLRDVQDRARLMAVPA